MIIRPSLRRARLGLIACIGLASLQAIAEAPPHQHHSPAPPGSAAATRADGYDMNSANLGPGSQQLHQAHMNALQEMQRMRLSGDVDRDFAQMMKNHHEQGVKMAEIEAAEGKSPELKAMAKKIVKSQRDDIRQLDNWLKKSPEKRPMQ
ncbi:MAG: hypothetical protein K0S46_2193 [Moraxellaceae bacterium]|jgi:uncharacterized protein (DUF305 family)|nr:hypothetical protein [Moraxellaceae bacterium]